MNLLPDLRRFITRAEPEPENDTDEAAAAYAAGTSIDDARLQQSLRRPIVGGSIVVGFMFIVLLLWGLLSISGAILAPGVVRVEINS